MFFEAVNSQARNRDEGIILDLEEYIDWRRDNSGCKPSFDLIEYAYDIELPEDVVEHPTMKAINQATNDLVTWSNVCRFFFFSCKRMLTLIRRSRTSFPITSSNLAGTPITCLSFLWNTMVTVSKAPRIMLEIFAPKPLTSSTRVVLNFRHGAQTLIEWYNCTARDVRTGLPGRFTGASRPRGTLGRMELRLKRRVL